MLVSLEALHMLIMRWAVAAVLVMVTCICGCSHAIRQDMAAS